MATNWNNSRIGKMESWSLVTSHQHLLEKEKTTTSGLVTMLFQQWWKTVVPLREPSLGPVLRDQGWSCRWQVRQGFPIGRYQPSLYRRLPCHWDCQQPRTALIDNHIHHGNELGIDSRRITWKRVVDSERRNRSVSYCRWPSRKNKQGSSWRWLDITVAWNHVSVSPENILDLKERLDRIITGYNYQGQPVTAKDLKAGGHGSCPQRCAIKFGANLEYSPVIHGRPFANIAHGCNSVLATS